MILIFLFLAGSLPRCEIAEDDWDIISQLYRTPLPERSYKELIDQNHHFVLNGLIFGSRYIVLVKKN